MNGLVRYKLERRWWRACGEDVSFADVKIKIQNRKVDQWMWMTSCIGSARGGFWEIWKSQLRHRTRRVDFQGLQRPDEFARYGCRTRWGSDGKVIIERLYIFLPYAETFNSKVIKGFVPELRSRYVFFVFRDSDVLCIYVMNILCTFHVFVSGYVTSIVTNF